MGRSRIRWFALLAGLFSSLLMLGTIPASADPVFLFSSCQDARNHLVQAPDGQYILLNNGRAFTVYCYDMAGTPREYISLADTGTDVNFSQYTAGGASPGTNVRTTFTKVRVDPSTLTVDLGDLTFSSSTGSLRHGGAAVTSMPYATAMSCVAAQNAAGVGNIDLQNTPFQVNDSFPLGGYLPAGGAKVSQNNQLVDLSGGGYCGWIMPAPGAFNPFNPGPGLYLLNLACAQSANVPGSNQFCVKVS